MAVEAKKKRGRKRHVVKAIPKIIDGLIAGKSNVQIARECGISDDSVKRVMGDQEFADQIQLLAQDILSCTDKPVILKAGLKDRLTAIGIAVDKARLLRDQPTQIVSGGDRVNVLISRLQSLHIGKHRLAEITDGRGPGEADPEPDGPGTSGPGGRDQ